MYNEEADMTILRAVGSRAFVDIETHAPKMGNQRSANLVTEVRPIVFTTGLSEESWKDATSTFLEIPPYFLRPPDNEIDYTDQDAYIDDVFDHTFFLDPFISGKTGGTPDPANAHLREKIQEMLRDNAVTSRPPEDNRSMPLE